MADKTQKGKARTEKNSEPKTMIRPGASDYPRAFLRAFGQNHGFYMGCPKCRVAFHPGSLVVSEKGKAGQKIIVHYKCRTTKTKNTCISDIHTES